MEQVRCLLPGWQGKLVHQPVQRLVWVLENRFGLNNLGVGFDSLHPLHPPRVAPRRRPRQPAPEPTKTKKPLAAARWLLLCSCFLEEIVVVILILVRFQKIFAFHGVSFLLSLSMRHAYYAAAVTVP